MHICVGDKTLVNSIAAWLLRSCSSEGIGRQGLGSFCKRFLRFNTAPFCAMPLLAHIRVLGGLQEDAAPWNFADLGRDIHFHTRAKSSSTSFAPRPFVDTHPFLQTLFGVGIGIECHGSRLAFDPSPACCAFIARESRFLEAVPSNIS